MSKIAIIIPSRLEAERLPYKPLKLINNKEMILHVYESALASKTGEVYVATPNQEIINSVETFGGNAIKTSNHHKTGTDRVFEVFEKTLQKNPEIIVNLQGDMPNIQSKEILRLVKYMQKNQCDICTLASKLNSKVELENPNIVKVSTKKKIEKNLFSEASDFFRKNVKSPQNLYHHVGIYAFTKEAIMRYVKLKRSKLEIERNLEQLRALENKMSIHVGYTEEPPLSVDTEEDLKEIRHIMRNNEEN